MMSQSITQRLVQRQQWLDHVLQGHPIQVMDLAGDASFRHYARITIQDEHNNCSYMLMDAPPEKENCYPFVQIAQYLSQHGARVPQIVAQDMAQGFLLLEDFGDELLSKHLNGQTVDSLYQQAFVQIIQLQSIPRDAALFPVYGAEKLRQEMQLFNEWLLPALAIWSTPAQQQMLDMSYTWLIEQIERQPKVIVHRDYHSRNLMLLKESAALGVIDFQDAVYGADTYDLISLIRDAYVQWSPSQVQHWIKQFYQMLPDSATQQRSLAQFYLDVDVMSIQRHLKVLGIFVRLFERDGKAGYLKDLPRVMWYFCQELSQLAQYVPVLAEFNTFIQQVVLPRFNQQYGMYTSSTP